MENNYVGPSPFIHANKVGSSSAARPPVRPSGLAMAAHKAHTVMRSVQSVQEVPLFPSERHSSSLAKTPSVSASSSLNPKMESSPKPLPSVIASQLETMVQAEEIAPEEKEQILGKLEALYNKPFKTARIIPGSNPIGIFWRGCSAKQLINMVKNESAGGLPANNEASPPNEDEVRKQVGELSNLPEFTSSNDIAKRFARGKEGEDHFIVQALVQLKYTKEGSGVEAGYVTGHDAPVLLMAFQSGESFESLLAKNKSESSVSDISRRIRGVQQRKSGLQLSVSAKPIHVGELSQVNDVKENSPGKSNAQN